MKLVWVVAEGFGLGKKSHRCVERSGRHEGRKAIYIAFAHLVVSKKNNSGMWETMDTLTLSYCQKREIKVVQSLISFNFLDMCGGMCSVYIRPSVGMYLRNLCIQ